MPDLDIFLSRDSIDTNGNSLCLNDTIDTRCLYPQGQKSRFDVLLVRTKIYWHEKSLNLNGGPGDKCPYPQLQYSKIGTATNEDIDSRQGKPSASQWSIQHYMLISPIFDIGARGATTESFNCWP